MQTVEQRREYLQRYNQRPEVKVRKALDEARRRQDVEYAERQRVYCRAWYKASPQRQHAYRLKKQYGLTAEEYARILTIQGGVCAICHQPPTGGSRTKRLHVDHDHLTGMVRGLLCVKCNLTCGIIESDRHRGCVLYLERAKRLHVVAA